MAPRQSARCCRGSRPTQPKIGRPGNFYYEVHEIVGLLTLDLVLAFWLWAMLRQRGMPVGALLPRFSAARRSALIADARASFTALRERRLPALGTEAPLASAVHGLGLLAALAMGANGAWLYTMRVPAGLVLKAHKVIANLLWAYLIGHAGIAVLYQFTKQPVLRTMFRGEAAQQPHPTPPIEHNKNA